MQNVNIKNQNDNEKLRGNLVALRNSKCKNGQKSENFKFYTVILHFDF